jgi:hypothetical protein
MIEVVGFGYQTSGIPTARIVDAPTFAVSILVVPIVSVDGWINLKSDYLASKPSLLLNPRKKVV